MGRELNSLGEMAVALALRVPEMALALHHGLERAAQVIEARRPSRARTRSRSWSAPRPSRG
jgi:hypothetical protein